MKPLYLGSETVRMRMENMISIDTSNVETVSILVSDDDGNSFWEKI